MMKRSLIEERLMLLEQADDYLKAADNVSDQLTKSSLLFLSSSSIHRAEQITLVLCEDSDDNCSTTNDKLDDSTYRNDYTVYRGRIKTTNSSRIDGIENITKSLKGSSVINDLFDLERKLADLDLFNIRKASKSDIEYTSANTNNNLEESFVLLSATARQVRTEAKIHDAKARKLSSNPYGNSNLVTGAKVNPAWNMGLWQWNINAAGVNNKDKSKVVVNDTLNLTEANSSRSSNSHLSEESVTRLLQCISRLTEENNTLMKKIDILNSTELNRIRVVKEIEEFKAEFSNKFKKLKSMLEDFTKQFPHTNNPANIYTLLANKDLNNNAEKSSNFETNSQRQEQLERMVQALLNRLEKSRIIIDVKDKTIAKYEKYIRQFKSNDETIVNNNNDTKSPNP